MKIIENNKPLAVVACGYEQGGTTLVSQILKQHPKLDSGFECGFLLVDHISDFSSLEPYCNITKASWKITNDDLNFICKTENWGDAYQRLLDRSKLIQDKSVLLIDKTPKYMSVLSEVLPKVPDIPCIVIVRDPRAVIWSWTKRLRPNLKEWSKDYINTCCKRYISYALGWKKATQNNLSDRILLIQYESLCCNPKVDVKRMFDFIGFDFEEMYLDIGSRDKFPNIYQDHISNQYMDEYKSHLPEEVCQEILKQTSEFNSWFWEAS